MVVGINTTLHPRERDPMPLVQEAGRAAGLVSCGKSPPPPPHWDSIPRPPSL